MPLHTYLTPKPLSRSAHHADDRGNGKLQELQVQTVLSCGKNWEKRDRNQTTTEEARGGIEVRSCLPREKRREGPRGRERKGAKVQMGGGQKKDVACLTLGKRNSPGT